MPKQTMRGVYPILVTPFDEQPRVDVPRGLVRLHPDEVRVRRQRAHALDALHLGDDAVARAGGNVTHLDKHWHYAAGVHHPARRKPNDGLSLVPPRSALWLNARGERIGPVPLVGSTDTRFIIITHNPITMARMNRLFGVTMAERGVSQLVSVGLDDAVKILDQNVA